MVFLCTDEAAAANINGYTFLVVGGEVGLYSEPQVIKSINKDIKKDGLWTMDELVQKVPKTLAEGLINPSPPKQAK